MLGKRVLSAVVALPLLVVVLGYLPDGAFSSLLVVVSAISAREYYAMASPRKQLYIVGPALSVILAGGLLFAPFPRIVTVGIILLSVMALLVSRQASPDAVLKEGGCIILGVVYTGLLVPFLGFINTAEPNGTTWLAFLFAMVWGSDTGAYFAGRWLGRHKLYPRVSPGKTWEGAVGGVGASILVSIVFKWWWITSLGWPVTLGIAITVAVIGQIGDLFESLIKRAYGVKDSGAILPGHGGMLDRIDAVIFAAPIVLMWMTVVGRW